MVTKERVMEDNITYLRVSAYYAIATIIVTSLVLFFLINRANREFLPEDPQPELFPLVPETIATKGYPDFVTVGLFIKDFTEFSLITNQFEFSGIVWFIADPSKVSLETLGKFSFERGKILAKSEPTTKIIDSTILVRFDVRVSFKTNLNFAQFPFDNHRLSIILDNTSVSPGELAFNSSFNELTVSPKIKITGWNLKNTFVATGYSSATLSHEVLGSAVAHPRAVFTLEYVHSGIRQAMLVIFPLLLIFFMALFSFCIDSKYYKTITGISSGAVTAMLAYRFVIERLSPQVGYFTTTDYIFFVLLVAVIAIFFINVGLPTFRAEHRKTIITLLPLVVIGSFLILLGV